VDGVGVADFLANDMSLRAVNHRPIWSATSTASSSGDSGLQAAITDRQRLVIQQSWRPEFVFVKSAFLTYLLMCNFRFTEYTHTQVGFAELP
jgi:hypothetical protein